MMGCGPNIPAESVNNGNTNNAYYEDVTSTQYDNTVSDNFQIEVNKKIKFDPTQVFDLFKTDKLDQRYSTLVHQIEFGENIIMKVYDKRTGMRTQAVFKMTQEWKESFLGKNKYEYRSTLRYVSPEQETAKTIPIKLTVNGKRLKTCVIGSAILSKKEKVNNESK